MSEAVTIPKSVLKSKRYKDLVPQLAAEELRRRKAENPLKYFIPNGAQERLIRAVGSPKHDLYVMPAANSVGKSAIVINILGNFIWGPQSEWYQHGRFAAEWKFPKKFWYMSEQSTLKDFVCGIDEAAETEIKKWFPPNRYEMVKAGYDFFSRFTSDTGWSGAFKTYDMDPSKFESDKIGIAIFDEPPPKAIYNAVMARMTLGGIVIMPMTPLFSSAWVQDEIVDKAPDDPSIYVFYADIEENCKQHGVRGILDHSQIEKVLSRYDADEYDARAKGVFMHLSGLIYRGIHPDVHQFEKPEPKEFRQDKYQIYCVCDPHDAKPPLVGWFAVDQWQNVWCVAEYPSQPSYPPFHEIKNWKKPTTDVVREMMNIEQAHMWDPKKIIRVMDPNFGVKPVAAVGRTIRETYADAARKMGYSMNFSVAVSDDLVAGHQHVRDVLAQNGDGDVRLRFHKSVRNIWYQMTHYSWRPVSDKKEEVDGLSEMVGQKFKHGADVVRYMVVYMRKVPAQAVTETITTLDDVVYKVILPKLRKRASRGGKNKWARR